MNLTAASSNLTCSPLQSESSSSKFVFSNVNF
jgi:hypothetical protein